MNIMHYNFAAHNYISNVQPQVEIFHVSITA